MTCLLAAASYLAPAHGHAHRHAPARLSSRRSAPGRAARLGNPRRRRCGRGICRGAFPVTGRSRLPVVPYPVQPLVWHHGIRLRAGLYLAGNARENKLTPWYNDTRSDNRGELLLLRVGPDTYDLCNGARATFAPGSACTKARPGRSARLEVRILPDGGARASHPRVNPAVRGGMQRGNRLLYRAGAGG